MGTRGVVGFHRNGIDKITYNHFDSYPSDLGKRVKDFLMTTPVDEMMAIFDRIIMVNETQPPTRSRSRHVNRSPIYQSTLVNPTTGITCCAKRRG